MASIRYISTINIKPGNVSATNLKPGNSSTINYAGSHIYGTKYGEFKYAAKTYGASTEYSVGQKMPDLSTREV